MQVESLFTAHARLAGITLLSAILLPSFAGCHREPAPDVVATVNGKDILRSDLDRKYQIIRMSQGEGQQEPSAEQANIARLTILRQMIDEEIFQQRAAKLNIAASDEDVNAAVTEKKLPFTQEEFEKQLKDHKETLDDFKNELRHQLTDTKLINKEIDSKINITDAEITNFYEAHKADFNFIEPRYDIARIAVTDTPSQPTNNLQSNKAAGPADAKSKIEILHHKLENGEDFGVVAANYSEDKDVAGSGGDMGWVPESQLQGTADVYAAIGKLKPGQFSDVLPITDPGSRKVVGYAIYKLIAKEAAGQRQLNNVQVQATIRNSLREGRAQMLRTAYIEVLRDDAKVHNYLADEILKAGAK